MVVDSSAIVAIVLREPERVAFKTQLESATDPVLSTASLVECSVVLHRRLGSDGLDVLDTLLRATRVRLVPFDAAQARAARVAWTRYGRGNSSARLNFGDCFSYALATTLDRPLLFKGGDFSRTDVRVVVTPTVPG